MKIALFSFFDHLSLFQGFLNSFANCIDCFLKKEKNTYVLNVISYFSMRVTVIAPGKNFGAGKVGNEVDRYVFNIYRHRIKNVNFNLLDTPASPLPSLMILVMASCRLAGLAGSACQLRPVSCPASSRSPPT